MENRNQGLSDLKRFLDLSVDKEIDIIERVRNIVILWNRLGFDKKNKDYLKMVGIDSQTDHLPKGRVREGCNKESLERADKESEEHEVLFLGVFDSASRHLLETLKKTER